MQANARTQVSSQRENEVLQALEAFLQLVADRAQDRLLLLSRLDPLSSRQKKPSVTLKNQRDSSRSSVVKRRSNRSRQSRVPEGRQRSHRRRQKSPAQKTANRPMRSRKLENFDESEVKPGDRSGSPSRKKLDPESDSDDEDFNRDLTASMSEEEKQALKKLIQEREDAWRAAPESPQTRKLINQHRESAAKIFDDQQDCKICWEELEAEGMSSYEMKCCGLQLHLFCIERCMGSRNVRANCVSCMAPVGIEEIKDIVQRRKEEKRRERELALQSRNAVDQFDFVGSVESFRGTSSLSSSFSSSSSNPHRLEIVPSQLGLKRK
eukprot:gb/GEZN01004636.1/.p1 GENE.gb/GEZN01004636.1/~~gb/GEZN01004636.1/.p1  ORF type:complete len:323 (-),score=40.08 gb/GEZN01004636.1/:902-1870(-)